MRFNLLFHRTLLGWFFLWGMSAFCQEFHLITSEKTHLTQITRFQLRNLFLGKLEVIGSEPVFPVDLNEKRPQSQRFHNLLFGDHFDWGAYWIDQAVKGGPEKPYSIDSQALMLAFLERNKGYIGYIPRTRRADLSTFKLKILRLLE